MTGNVQLGGAARDEEAWRCMLVGLGANLSGTTGELGGHFSPADLLLSVRLSTLRDAGVLAAVET